MTPPKLGAKEFEGLLLNAAEREEKAGRLTMVRYGVQTMVGKDGKLLAVPSLPDFDGVTCGGAQFIVEAKVCSQASFPLQLDKIKPRQVRHMLSRSKFGVPCFVIIHWCERVGKNFHEPGETIAIPVNARLTFWQAFVDEAAAAKREDRKFVSPGSITRDHSCRIGTRVEWTCPPRCKTHLPDLAALLGVQPTQSEFSL